MEIRWRVWIEKVEWKSQTKISVLRLFQNMYLPKNDHKTWRKNIEKTWINPNAKKKKNCNDSNIYNKKLEIKEIYWENILTKFSKSNSYDHATIFDLCQ